MRFVVDMNLTVRWVSYLRSAGHDAVHWSELGANSAADQEICAYAREHGGVVVTNDLDFPQILAHTGAAGPSIVLLRGHPLTPESRGVALLAAISHREAELTSGAILTLDAGHQPRARVLPLSG